MEIILLLVVAWWIFGVFGCRKCFAKKRKSSSYKPDTSFYDWDEFQKRNATYAENSISDRPPLGPIYSTTHPLHTDEHSIATILPQNRVNRS